MQVAIQHNKIDLGLGAITTSPYPDWFDANSYLNVVASNRDLAPAGFNNAALAWQHFNAHGKFEGRLIRPIPADFNASAYLFLHPDVAKYVAAMKNIPGSANTAEKHYSWHGSFEKRPYIIPANITSSVAIQAANDIKAKAEAEAARARAAAQAEIDAQRQQASSNIELVVAEAEKKLKDQEEQNNMMLYAGGAAILLTTIILVVKAKKAKNKNK